MSNRGINCRRLNAAELAGLDAMAAAAGLPRERLAERVLRYAVQAWRAQPADALTIFASARFARPAPEPDEPGLDAAIMRPDAPVARGRP